VCGSRVLGKREIAEKKRKAGFDPKRNFQNPNPNPKRVILEGERSQQKGLKGRMNRIEAYLGSNVTTDG
jgi:hypothetical protein